MPDETAFLLGQIAADVRSLKEELAEFKTDVKARLDAGDKRFETIAVAAATHGVERKVALKLGALVLTATAAVGGGALTLLYTYAPALAAWLAPPKH